MKESSEVGREAAKRDAGLEAQGTSRREAKVSVPHGLMGHPLCSWRLQC